MPNYPNTTNNNSGKMRVVKTKTKFTIGTTWTIDSIDAINRFKDAKGFIRESDVIRYIVNTVLIKEGYLGESK